VAVAVAVVGKRVLAVVGGMGIAVVGIVEDIAGIVVGIVGIAVAEDTVERSPEIEAVIGTEEPWTWCQATAAPPLGRAAQPDETEYCLTKTEGH